ncbi:MAG: SDR family NAD(P)-dependent oxidoreductase [Pseudonocardia sp.]|uniref:SDR family NAD(P)-dependent oxidoreductase n=1 Tax=unclassified Pseudonocardia TaxID=2619320 RepID=UPI00086DF7A1|nr:MULTISPECIES: SDR family NAD(P)-dependent oxidoreductase [unclassified Pseudonocardia]MBN9110862.1 SDR family NAD(P)-dependent oxidoreductase [Pseudonocardia sp.]ODU26841.1 MAG: hypothetical protein ABS80_05650 [Pseudonocardia sp. SCN 72-51]ODV05437.1 MAG: hypothetical protein ABT15_17320 [Pseudonocardia sp. SCN 73-27]
MGMLEGKVAFITGGARGQGRAHAITCAREGADVVIVDVVSDVVETTYGLATADDHAETVKLVREYGRRVIDVEADVRDQDALDAAVGRAVDELGHIDIVIANAGIHAFAPFWELTEEQWDAMIGINLTGAWKTIKADTALYLNSDLAANVTGQNISVDNGHLLLPGSNPTGTG